MENGSRLFQSGPNRPIELLLFQVSNRFLYLLIAVIQQRAYIAVRRLLCLLRHVPAENRGKEEGIDKGRQGHAKQHEKHGNLRKKIQGKVGEGHNNNVNRQNSQCMEQMPDRHKERIKKRFLNCVVKPALEGEYIRSDEN